MQIDELDITGVKVITLNPIRDERGYFVRTYDIELATKYGFHHNWVQESTSLSKNKGTLRGLHYQLPPFSETKLIRVVSGSIFNVFLDIRKNSPSFGKWGSYILSSSKPQWILLPSGIANGMITLEDNMIMQYKMDNFFDPNSASRIKWDDPYLNIKWPSKPKIISEKDQKAQSFNEFINTTGSLDVKIN